MERSWSTVEREESSICLNLVLPQIFLHSPAGEKRLAHIKSIKRELVKSIKEASAATLNQTSTKDTKLKPQLVRKQFTAMEDLVHWGVWKENVDIDNFLFVVFTENHHFIGQSHQISEIW